MCRSTPCRKSRRYGEEAIRGVDYAGAVKKLNKRTPELVKATTDQLHLLNDDLTKRGNKVFDQTFTAAVKEHDKKIRAMFPDANEEKVSGLMANLTQEAQDQVADINDTLFSAHKKALDDIVTDMTLIQHSEPTPRTKRPPGNGADDFRHRPRRLEESAARHNNKTGTKARFQAGCRKGEKIMSDHFTSSPEPQKNPTPLPPPVTGGAVVVESGDAADRYVASELIARTRVPARYANRQCFGRAVCPGLPILHHQHV